MTVPQAVAAVGDVPTTSRPQPGTRPFAAHCFTLDNAGWCRLPCKGAQLAQLGFKVPIDVLIDTASLEAAGTLIDRIIVNPPEADDDPPTSKSSEKSPNASKRPESGQKALPELLNPPTRFLTCLDVW